LKEEALDRTLWISRFGRGYGPVVRQTAEWRGYGPVVRQTAEWMTFLIQMQVAQTATTVLWITKIFNKTRAILVQLFSRF
jgi:hypothetical protein